MRKEELKILLEKLDQGQLKAEEAQQLAAWDAMLDTRKGLTELLDDEETLQLKNDLYKKVIDGISRPESPVIPFYRRSWTRIAAAVILLTGGAFLYFYNKPTVPLLQPPISFSKNDIAPGSNKAVLTLSNGQTIVLDDKEEGILASEENSKVAKTDKGHIAYLLSDPSPGKMLYHTLSTPRGGQYKLTLPDGTNVWLNAASSITYPVAFQGNTREVDIKGEVYFEVENRPAQSNGKRTPFIVRVNGMSVEVLGTDFNINAYTDEDAIRTTLLSGKVRVLTGGSGSGNLVLKPGQQSQVDADGKMRVNNQVNTDAVISWKNGLFHFNHADLKTVMRQLEKWYDVEVQYMGEVPAQHFEGKLQMDLTLSQVLKILQKSDVHFTVTGRKIIVQK